MRFLDRCDRLCATTRRSSAARHGRAITIVRTAIAPLALIAQLGVAAAVVNAQRPEPAAAQWVHESWTVRDGLPVNSIREIIQDRAGYIWAATFDGLVRFDGVRFTVYNSANSDELPSNRIVSLVEARDGALWLTTEQGHVVRFRAGEFTNIAFEGGKPGAGLVSLCLVPSLVFLVLDPRAASTIVRKFHRESRT